MSRDILEEAMRKTEEAERKHIKRVRAARMVGAFFGTILAIALDGVLVWAIVNYLIGVPVGYLPVFGGLLMLQYAMDKIRQLKNG